MLFHPIVVGMQGKYDHQVTWTQIYKDTFNISNQTGVAQPQEMHNLGGSPRSTVQTEKNTYSMY